VSGGIPTGAPPTRRTRRLVLRAPEAADVDTVFAIQGDAAAMRFTYCAPDRAATAAFLAAHADRFAQDGFAPWVAILAAEDRLVGWGGLIKDPKAPEWGVEVAYFFAPSVWGRGLASELVAASLAHAFDDLGLPEVGAFVRPANLASVRVLTKAGFARTGFVPELERDAYRAAASNAPTLSIVPYDPDWPDAFARERDRIAAALGDLAIRIEHNGSTAVPGLAAKPVIDVQVSVRSLAPLAPYADRLAAIGYVHVPHEDDAVCPFFHRPAMWPHTHHVHVVASGSDEERRTLAFRDYLRANPETARAYEALKRELAGRHRADDFSAREAYAEAKTGFVARVTERALLEGLPHER
jgi:ribosomal-protein-alanine N-acetyltransferase